MKTNSWHLGAGSKLTTTILTFLSLLVWTACSDNSQNLTGPGGSASAKGKAMDVPTLTCAGSTQTSISLTITAGLNTGAPAGFTVQWMTASALAAANGVWPSSSAIGACDASFSGNANISRYNLAPGASVTVSIGDLLFDNGASSNCVNVLQCGTDYVFRVFAHATSTISKSSFSSNTTCSTTPCHSDGVCTYSQGYFRTHNDGVCALDATSPLCYAWPVSGLTLGTVYYTNDQLVAILQTTPAGGNGLVSLAHQLIAAKLNIARGADGSAAATDIATADALIGGLVVPSVGSGFLSGSSTSALVTSLDAYNTGGTGPGHCGDEPLN